MSIQSKNIEKYYRVGDDFIKVLDRVDLIAEQGDFIAIMGPSGSGKTTLLNCLSTIDSPDSGYLEINNIVVNKQSDDVIENIRKSEIGFLFQDFSLISTLTANENILLAQNIAGLKKDQAEINKLAQLLKIEHLLNKYDHQLSGGEKQRVAMVRALIKHPSILFLDEPTGALDSSSTVTLLNHIKEVNEKLNTTVIMVTHDYLSASYANEVIFLRDGKIIYKLNKTNDDNFIDELMSHQHLVNGTNNVY